MRMRVNSEKGYTVAELRKMKFAEIQAKEDEGVQALLELVIERARQISEMLPSMDRPDVEGWEAAATYAAEALGDEQ